MGTNVTHLTAYRDFISCIPRLYLYTLASDGTLLYRNETDESSSAFLRFFFSCGYLERAIRHFETADVPYSLSIYMGLVWYAVAKKDAGTLRQIHLLGPVFHHSVHADALEKTLRGYEKKGMTFRSRRMFIPLAMSLPVIPINQFSNYALMLHYAVNNVRLTLSDLTALPDTPEPEDTAAFPSPESSPEASEAAINASMYEQIWRSETLFLSVVSQNTPISSQSADALARRLIFLPTDAAGIRETSRQIKNTFIVLLAHTSRDVIRQGVLPAASYRLADYYLGEIEHHHSPTGIRQLLEAMQHDFSVLLSDARQDSRRYSPVIRRCLDYIKNHVTEEISLTDMAGAWGYTPYYLSRRFKEETGSSLRAYIREQKIRYAANLLVTTDLPIAEIVNAVSLSSRSQFSQAFHAIMGVSPGNYRKQRRT